MQAQQNFVGWDGMADCTSGKTAQWGGNVNSPFCSGGVAGLAMSSTTVAKAAANYGTLAVGGATAPGMAVELIPHAASEEELFAAFEAGRFQPAAAAKPSRPSPPGSSWCGGVVQTTTVPAGATRTVDFYLAWHFPNRPPAEVNDPNEWTAGNYYSNLFSDAPDVLSKAHARAAVLRGATRSYVEALFGSTIPPALLDSAASRLAVMRSPTMWQSRGGVVLGTEGNGCCPLNCTHVYGYTTLLERLYPDLAQDMCITNFVRTYNQSQGGVTMRFGSQWAIDGALACVIKAYISVRQADSKLTFLKRVWPNVKQQMDFLFAEFDDGNGVITCAQEDTYDTYMMGANTFIGSYYITALKAASRMAALMGDATTAERYAGRAALSATNYEKICWSEKFGYYVADTIPYPYRAPVPPAGAKYGNKTYGGQCFIDQLCAIGLSSAAGLGHILEPAHEAAARKAILKLVQHHRPTARRETARCTLLHGRFRHHRVHKSEQSSGR
jgi:hypothetical protein